ncbi:hypothetical protein GSI_11159 [Ganoderma sinense ZZ0214-1]|uniref:Uncharacterized protein n=1 Tax=Ganoderma sinense ZZ0214-1 TaxID=1077348 RepID=A0A2G8RZ19_9APHY|nr:hypothetical protein GSI_11159 [Ganoderma sinense ZZ0214-1]
MYLPNAARDSSIFGLQSSFVFIDNAIVPWNDSPVSAPLGLVALMRPGCTSSGLYQSYERCGVISIGATFLWRLQSRSIVNTNTRNAFPALQKLRTADRLSNGNGADFFEFSGTVTVLPLISSTSLTVLGLAVLLNSPDKIPEYFDEICSSAALAPLRQLHCTLGIARPIVTHRIPFADILPHLARLPALTDLSISAESHCSPAPSVLVALLDVCDEDLAAAAAAAAWPDLARLRIAYSDWAGRCRGPCMPSLGAVVTLAGRCRKLERVDVEFADVDADELVWNEARAAATSASTGLRLSLRAGCTPAQAKSKSSQRQRRRQRHTQTQTQTALRRIATVSALKPLERPNRYLMYKHHERLSVAEPVRLAAALRKLFPNLRSGLEESQLAEGMEDGQGRGDNGMVLDSETDAMRLLRALDELDLDAELYKSMLFQWLIVGCGVGIACLECTYII